MLSLWTDCGCSLPSATSWPDMTNWVQQEDTGRKGEAMRRALSLLCFLVCLYVSDSICVIVMCMQVKYMCKWSTQNFQARTGWNKNCCASRTLLVFYLLSPVFCGRTVFFPLIWYVPSVFSPPRLLSNFVTSKEWLTDRCPLLSFGRSSRGRLRYFDTMFDLSVLFSSIDVKRE